MVKEPHILINGYRLTDGQAMTIRVAIEYFALGLQEIGDEVGYLDRIAEIREMVMKP